MDTDFATWLRQHQLADLSMRQTVSLSLDSREVGPGCIFFALRGSKHHGSDFINDAIRQGAIAVLTDQADPTRGQDVPVVCVPNAHIAFAEAAAAFYGHPSRTLQLCGVTGTSGKTSVTYLIEALLDQAGVIGTVTTRFANRVTASEHTTPNALELNKILRSMCDHHIQSAVMEVSSHAIDQNRIHGLDFDVCVLTNVTRDHLDYHGTAEHYLQIKKNLFTRNLLASGKKRRVAVLNLDDPVGEQLLAMLKNNPAVDCMTYSVGQKAADARVESFTQSIHGLSATISFFNTMITFESSMIGVHNLSNSLAAMLAAYAMTGVQPQVSKLRQVSIPGRLQRINQSNVFVDYAHKPDALEKILITLRQVVSQDHVDEPLIVVFGCGGDRDRGKRPLMGQIASAYADQIILTNDNPRTEDPDTIISDIRSGIPKTMDESGKIHVVPDRRQAIEYAIRLAGQNGTVLVAGKGHETYQIVGSKKLPFDDEEVIKSYLVREGRS